MRPATKALASLVLAAGCSKPSSPSTAPSGSARPSAPAVSRSVTEEEQSSTSAFELVASSAGLRLLWASAAPGPDWLNEAVLGQSGERRGAVRRISVAQHSLGKVSDLSAVFLGEQLAVAWLEQGPKEARAQAVVTGAAAPVLLDLGPSALVAEAARGNIAIAAEPGLSRALVMWRGLEAPCVGGEAGPCTAFAFRRIGVGVVDTTGLPLSVPVPCASHSVELATSKGRFHYGVCTREGSDPITTMFTIQYEPEYARAEPLLKGCVPLGTLDMGDKPWFIGDCHGKRRAVPVPLMDEKVEVENIDALDITCTAQRLELRQGKFVLRLREPRAGLEGVLPASFVPTGARVGWTGSTLVIAYKTGVRLETRAYGCQGGKLAPLASAG